MRHRTLRRLLADPFYLVMIAALVLGATLGRLVAREGLGEELTYALGRAWRGTPDGAREALATMFGLQFTVLTIVLSLNAPVVQSAANQYSPRLVPFYLKNAPLRRAVPLFVLATGYIVAALRELGLAATQTPRPQPIVTGALALLVGAFALLMIDLNRTFRFMRVERVLALVRQSAFEAADRLRDDARSLALDRVARLALPAWAHPLPSPASGYVVRVDVARLARVARRAGVRVRISRPVGDYVDEGEVVGWVMTDAASGPVPPRVIARLASALEASPTRDPEYDPGYGIRILADVASRALSSSSNDSYTARQALQQLRSVLRHLARQPFGDWNVVDRDRTPRVSVMATDLREYVSLAIDAPLRHGANDLEVLDAVLEIALEMGLVAPDAEGRAVAHELVAKVMSDATRFGDLDDAKLAHLRNEAAIVRASIERNAPRAERLARAHWALPPRALVPTV
ncbi:DUF2254 domain-containing protein [Sandaracinus amylolyticus]|uniref:DUF2254 domain-containing protein n=1 Tax=Sandaracinus amylolyticus TaxID=927083 RepID=UPI001F439A42|nr:DUF2254 family protein [Sandaracinus amylolyticus]